MGILQEKERYLKRVLKNKVSINQGTVIAYLIAGFFGVQMAEIALNRNLLTEEAIAQYLSINPSTGQTGKDNRGNPTTPDQNMVLIAPDANNKGWESVIIGTKVNTNSTQTDRNNQLVVIGHEAVTDGSDIVAIGRKVNAKNTGAVAIGQGTKAGMTNTRYKVQSELTGNEKLGVATLSETASSATAVGYSAVADKGQSVAVGSKSYAGFQSTALGSDTYAVGNSSIAIGSDDIVSFYEDKVTQYDYDNYFKEIYKTKLIGDRTVNEGGAYGYDNTTGRPHGQYPQNRKYSPTIATAEGAIAIGSRALAAGIGSTSLGTLSYALKTRATALGTYSRAEGVGSAAIGSYTNVFADNSVGVGNNIQILNEGGMGYGYKAYAGGGNSIAIGSNVYANTYMDYTKQIRNNNGNVQNYDYTIHNTEPQRDNEEQIGYYLEQNATSASTNDKVDIQFYGNYSTYNAALEAIITSQAQGEAQGKTATIFPNLTTKNGVAGIVQGAKSSNLKQAATSKDDVAKNAIVIGSSSMAIGDNSIAFGRGAFSLAKNTFALGSYSYSDAENGMALGMASRALSKNSIAMGVGTGVGFKGENTVAIGTGSVAYGRNGILLGTGSRAGQVYRSSTAFPNIQNLPGDADQGRYYDGTGNIVIGNESKVYGNQNITFGNRINVHTGGKVENSEFKPTTTNNMALGREINIYKGVSNSVAIGTGSSIGSNTVENNEISNSAVFGVGAKVLNASDRTFVSDTNLSTVTGLPLTIGNPYRPGALPRTGQTGSNAMAIGNNSVATLENSVALGVQSKTDYTRDSLSKPGWVAPGAFSIPTSGNIGVISVGSQGRERRIVNLASGAEDTDAVNVAQLRSLSERLQLAVGSTFNVSGNGRYVSVEREFKDLVNDNGTPTDGIGDAGKISLLVDRREQFQNYIEAKSQYMYILARKQLNNEIFDDEQLLNLKKRVDEYERNPVIKTQIAAKSELKKLRIPDRPEAGDNVGRTFANTMALINAAKNADNAFVAKTDGNGILTTDELNDIRDSNYESNTALGKDSTAIGFQAKTDKNSAYSIAIGHKSNIDYAQDAVVIGREAKAAGTDTVTAKSSIAIGSEAKVTKEGAIAIGGASATTDDADGARATGTFAISVGAGSIASGNQAIAIGKGAQALIDGGIALGDGAQTSQNKDRYGYSISTKGQLSGTNQPLAWKSTVAALSLGTVDNQGNATQSRQITGVAAGTNDTDAVNVAQLKDAVPVISLAADTGNAVSRDLKEPTQRTIKVRSASWGADVNRYSTDNIETGVDNDGIYVGIKEQPTFKRVKLSSADAPQGGFTDTDLVPKKYVDDKLSGQTITYKAESGNANTVALSTGLDFVSDDLVIAADGANSGKVKFSIDNSKIAKPDLSNLNDTGKNKITETVKVTKNPNDTTNILSYEKVENKVGNVVTGVEYKIGVTKDAVIGAIGNTNKEHVYHDPASATYLTVSNRENGDTNYAGKYKISLSADAISKLNKVTDVDNKANKTLNNLEQAGKDEISKLAVQAVKVQGTGAAVVTPNPENIANQTGVTYTVNVSKDKIKETVGDAFKEIVDVKVGSTDYLEVTNNSATAGENGLTYSVGFKSDFKTKLAKLDEVDNKAGTNLANIDETGENKIKDVAAGAKLKYKANGENASKETTLSQGLTFKGEGITFETETGGIVKATVNQGLKYQGTTGGEQTTPLTTGLRFNSTDMDITSGDNGQITFALKNSQVTEAKLDQELKNKINENHKEYVYSETDQNTTKDGDQKYVVVTEEEGATDYRKKYKVSLTEAIMSKLDNLDENANDKYATKDLDNLTDNGTNKVKDLAIEAIDVQAPAKIGETNSQKDNLVTVTNSTSNHKKTFDVSLTADKVAEKVNLKYQGNDNVDSPTVKETPLSTGLKFTSNDMTITAKENGEISFAIKNSQVDENKLSNDLQNKINATYKFKTQNSSESTATERESWTSADDEITFKAGDGLQVSGGDGYIIYDLSAPNKETLRTIEEKLTKVEFEEAKTSFAKRDASNVGYGPTGKTATTDPVSEEETKKAQDAAAWRKAIGIHETLTFTGDNKQTGSEELVKGTVDLRNQTLDFNGVGGIEVKAEGQTLTLDIGAKIAENEAAMNALKGGLTFGYKGNTDTETTIKTTPLEQGIQFKSDKFDITTTAGTKNTQGAVNFAIKSGAITTTEIADGTIAKGDLDTALAKELDDKANKNASNVGLAVLSPEKAETFKEKKAEEDRLAKVAGENALKDPQNASKTDDEKVAIKKAAEEAARKNYRDGLLAAEDPDGKAYANAANNAKTWRDALDVYSKGDVYTKDEITNVMKASKETVSVATKLTKEATTENDEFSKKVLRVMKTDPVGDKAADFAIGINEVAFKTEAAKAVKVELDGKNNVEGRTSAYYVDTEAEGKVKNLATVESKTDEATGITTYYIGAKGTDIAAGTNLKYVGNYTATNEKINSNDLEANKKEVTLAKGLKFSSEELKIVAGEDGEIVLSLTNAAVDKQDLSEELRNEIQTYAKKDASNIGNNLAEGSEIEYVENYLAKEIDDKYKDKLAALNKANPTADDKKTALEAAKKEVEDSKPQLTTTAKEKFKEQKEKLKTEEAENAKKWRDAIGITEGELTYTVNGVQEASTNDTDVNKKFKTTLSKGLNFEANSSVTNKDKTITPITNGRNLKVSNAKDGKIIYSLTETDFIDPANIATDGTYKTDTNTPNPLATAKAVVDYVSGVNLKYKGNEGKTTDADNSAQKETLLSTGLHFTSDDLTMTAKENGEINFALKAKSITETELDDAVTSKLAATYTFKTQNNGAPNATDAKTWTLGTDNITFKAGEGLQVSGSEGVITYDLSEANKETLQTITEKLTKVEFEEAKTSFAKKDASNVGLAVVPEEVKQAEEQAIADKLAEKAGDIAQDLEKAKQTAVAEAVKKATEGMEENAEGRDELVAQVTKDAEAEFEKAKDKLKKELEDKVKADAKEDFAKTNETMKNAQENAKKWRDAIDVYAKDEVYNKTEIDNNLKASKEKVSIHKDSSKVLTLDTVEKEGEGKEFVIGINEKELRDSITDTVKVSTKDNNSGLVVADVKIEDSEKVKGQKVTNYVLDLNLKKVSELVANTTREKGIIAYTNANGDRLTVGRDGKIYKAADLVGKAYAEDKNAYYPEDKLYAQINGTYWFDKPEGWQSKEGSTDDIAREADFENTGKTAEYTTKDIKHSLVSTDNLSGENENKLNTNTTVLDRLSDGKIAADSTEAVNGSQIHDLNDKLATYLGGGAKFEDGTKDNPDGTWTAPSFVLSVGDKNGVNNKADGHTEDAPKYKYASVGEALAALDKARPVVVKDGATEKDTSTTTVYGSGDDKIVNLATVRETVDEATGKITYHIGAKPQDIEKNTKLKYVGNEENAQAKTTTLETGLKFSSDALKITTGENGELVFELKESTVKEADLEDLLKAKLDNLAKKDASNVGDKLAEGAEQDAVDSALNKAQEEKVKEALNKLKEDKKKEGKTPTEEEVAAAAKKARDDFNAEDNQPVREQIATKAKEDFAPKKAELAAKEAENAKAWRDNIGVKDAELSYRVNEDLEDLAGKEANGDYKAEDKNKTYTTTLAKGFTFKAKSDVTTAPVAGTTREAADAGATPTATQTARVDNLSVEKDKDGVITYKLRETDYIDKVNSIVESTVNSDNAGAGDANKKTWTYKEGAPNKVATEKAVVQYVEDRLSVITDNIGGTLNIVADKNPKADSEEAKQKDTTASVDLLKDTLSIKGEDGISVIANGAQGLTLKLATSGTGDNVIKLGYKGNQKDAQKQTVGVSDGLVFKSSDLNITSAPNGELTFAVKNDVIGTKNIIDGSILYQDLSEDAVHSINIANGAVGKDDIANGAVGLDHLDPALSDMMTSGAKASANINLSNLSPHGEAAIKENGPVVYTLSNGDRILKGGEPIVKGEAPKYYKAEDIKGKVYVKALEGYVDKDLAEIKEDGQYVVKIDKSLIVLTEDEQKEVDALAVIITADSINDDEVASKVTEEKINALLPQDMEEGEEKEAKKAEIRAELTKEAKKELATARTNENLKKASDKKKEILEQTRQNLLAAKREELTDAGKVKKPEAVDFTDGANPVRLSLVDFASQDANTLKNGIVLDKVADGKVSADSLEAINGSQLYDTIGSGAYKNGGNQPEFVINGGKEELKPEEITKLKDAVSAAENAVKEKQTALDALKDQPEENQTQAKQDLEAEKEKLAKAKQNLKDAGIVDNVYDALKALDDAITEGKTVPIHYGAGKTAKMAEIDSEKHTTTSGKGFRFISNSLNIEAESDGKIKFELNKEDKTVEEIVKEKGTIVYTKADGTRVALGRDGEVYTVDSLKDMVYLEIPGQGDNAEPEFAGYVPKSQTKEDENTGKLVFADNVTKDNAQKVKPITEEEKKGLVLSVVNPLTDKTRPTTGDDSQEVDQSAKLTNVAEGEISEKSKEAINGSQLYSTNKRVTALEDKVGDPDQKNPSNPNTPAGSDGLDDETLAKRVDALRRGEAGPVVYTINDGQQDSKDERVVKGFDGNYYKAKDLEGKVFVKENENSDTGYYTDYEAIKDKIEDKNKDSIYTIKLKEDGQPEELNVAENTKPTKLTEDQIANIKHTLVGKDGTFDKPSRLTNVEKGVADTDAVNVSQLKSADPVGLNNYNKRLEDAVKKAVDALGPDAQEEAKKAAEDKAREDYAKDNADAKAKAEESAKDWRDAIDVYSKAEVYNKEEINNHLKSSKETVESADEKYVTVKDGTPGEGEGRKFLVGLSEEITKKLDNLDPDAKNKYANKDASNIGLIAPEKAIENEVAEAVEAAEKEAIKEKLATLGENASENDIARATQEAKDEFANNRKAEVEATVLAKAEEKMPELEKAAQANAQMWRTAIDVYSKAETNAILPTVVKDEGKNDEGTIDYTAESKKINPITVRTTEENGKTTFHIGADEAKLREITLDTVKVSAKEGNQGLVVVEEIKQEEGKPKQTNYVLDLNVEKVSELVANTTREKGIITYTNGAGDRLTLGRDEQLYKAEDLKDKAYAEDKKAYYDKDKLYKMPNGTYWYDKPTSWKAKEGEPEEITRDADYETTGKVTVYTETDTYKQDSTIKHSLVAPNKINENLVDVDTVLDNVADGKISADSDEAINGSQLYDTIGGEAYKNGGSKPEFVINGGKEPVEEDKVNELKDAIKAAEEAVKAKQDALDALKDEPEDAKAQAKQDLADKQAELAEAKGKLKDAGIVDNVYDALKALDNAITEGKTVPFHYGAGETIDTATEDAKDKKTTSGKGLKFVSSVLDIKAYEDGNIVFKIDKNDKSVEEVVLEKGTVVYTKEDGTRISKGRDGKYYETAKLEDTVFVKNETYPNGAYISKDDVVEDPKTGKISLAPNKEITPIAALEDQNPTLVHSLVNPTVVDSEDTADKDESTTTASKLRNVAKGDISENSTDAINGSQLYATNNRVSDLEKKIGKGENPEDKRNGNTDSEGNPVPKDGTNGLDGAAGKDGLNGKDLTEKVNALRRGEAGALVYTDEDGNRVVRGLDGKYYKADDIADKVFVDKKGYIKPTDEQKEKLEDPDGDGIFTAKKDQNIDDLTSDVNPLTKDQADKIKHSLVNRDGTTDKPSTLANVGSGIGLGNYGAGTEATKPVKYDGATPEGVKKAQTDAAKLYELDGAKLNNAVTAGDLQAVAVAGLDFSGNDYAEDDIKTVVHRNLGTRVEIVGEKSEKPTKDWTKTAADNIYVDADRTNNKLEIKLAKELTNLTSVEAVDDDGNKAKLDGTGLTITPKQEDDATAENPNPKPISITKDGINAGDKPITNVGDGVDPADAVNKKQLDEVKALIGDPKKDGEDGRNGTHGADGNIVDDGKDGAAGKDGLNGKDLTEKVNALRRGEAGPVVYTYEKDGTEVRVVRGLDGKYYVASELENKVYVEGTGYVDADKAKAKKDGSGNELTEEAKGEGENLAKVAALTPEEAKNISHSLVGRDGTTTTPSKLNNVAAGKLSKDSTEAVNGSQLYAVGTSTAAAIGGGATFDPTTGTISKPSIVINRGLEPITEAKLKELEDAVKNATENSPEKEAAQKALEEAKKDLAGRTKDNLVDAIKELDNALTTGKHIPLSYGAGEDIEKAKADAKGKTTTLENGLKFVSSALEIKAYEDGNIVFKIDKNDKSVEEVVLEKGTVVYTKEDGTRISKGRDGKYYETAKLEDTVFVKNEKYPDGAYISKDDVVEDPKTGKISLNPDKQITPVAALKDQNPTLVHSLVNAKDGSTTEASKLTNLKEGEISKDSKDAVNGSQLYATNNRVSDLEKKIGKGENPEDKRNGNTDPEGNPVPKDGTNGLDGAAGKDGLNGKDLTEKVNALRRGEAGALVYTDEDGNRVVRGLDGKYYKADDIADKVFVDGKGYVEPTDEQKEKLEDPDGDGIFTVKKDQNIDDLVSGVDPLTKEQADKIKHSLVNRDGTTDKPSELANVGSGIGLGNYGAGTEATKPVKYDGATAEGVKKAQTDAAKLYELNGAKLNNAVTAGDLQAVAVAGLDFSGNDYAENDIKTVVHRNLGTRVEIVGEKSEKPTKDWTKTAADNIYVDADRTNNKLEIKLAKELTNLTSVEAVDDDGNKAKLDGTGLTITPKQEENATAENPNPKPISITKDGINAGDKPITNVGDGVDPADAVNKKQLDEVKALIGDPKKDGTDGTNGKDGTSAKDGLNGRDLTDKVNRLRNGEAGPVVYTMSDGTRIARTEDGNYYKLSDVYTVEEIEELKKQDPKTTAKAGDAKPNSKPLTDDEKSKIKHSLVNKDGDTTTPSVLSNVAAGEISKDSKDAVNGSQLYEIVENAKGVGNNQKDEKVIEAEKAAVDKLQNENPAATAKELSDAKREAAVKVIEAKVEAENKDKSPEEIKALKEAEIAKLDAANESAQNWRDAIDTYSKGEVYNKNQVYNKTEIDNITAASKETVETEDPSYIRIDNSTKNDDGGTKFIIGLSEDVKNKLDHLKTDTDYADNKLSNLDPEGENKVKNLATEAVEVKAVENSGITVKSTPTKVDENTTKVVHEIGLDKEKLGTKYAADNNVDKPETQELGTSLVIKSKESDAKKDENNFSGKNIITKYTQDKSGNGTVEISISDKPEFENVKAKNSIEIGEEIETTNENGEVTKKAPITISSEVDNETGKPTSSIEFAKDEETGSGTGTITGIKTVDDPTSVVSKGYVDDKLNSDKRTELTDAEGNKVRKVGEKDGVPIYVAEKYIDENGEVAPNAKPLTPDMLSNSMVSPTGSTTTPTRLSNIADGILANDAVNKAQLDRVDKKADKALSGVAHAVAMASLPQINDAGANKHNLAASVGHYEGRTAVALGVSGVSDSGRILYKVNASADNNKQFAVGAGLGYQIGQRNVTGTELERLQAQLSLLQYEKKSETEYLRERLAEYDYRMRQLMEEVERLKNR